MIPVPQNIVNSLAQLYGSHPDDLTHFGGGREESDGIIFSYPHHGTRRLLKVLAIPVEDNQRGLFCFEERLQFARYLGENGARIAFPQLSPQGNLYETIGSEERLWIAYTMEIAPGKSRSPREWNEPFFRKWGSTIGLMHRLAAQYPTWESSIDSSSGNEYLTWREEWQGFHEWSQDEEVMHEWEMIKRKLEELPRTREVFGFIHNDPHLWNLLVDGDVVTVLDFDVANHHWFINDIAIACQSVLFALSGGLEKPIHSHNKLLRFLTTFLKGYNEEYHLSAEWLDRLDLFIAYRRILLYTVMYEGISSSKQNHVSWKRMIIDGPEVVGSLSEKLNL